MRRSASEWGEYTADQGLYGLRANNAQAGGNLNLRSSVPATEGLDMLFKEDERNFQGYIANPLALHTNRVTSEEVEVEKDQGVFDRMLGRDPETETEVQPKKERVWVASQERDFFDEYDLDGTDTVSYMHIPFTEGESDIRDRGGNGGQYERLDILFPGASDVRKIGRDLQEELENQGNLNRFAEGLADHDGDMDIIYRVTQNGGEFAPEGLVEVKGSPSPHPAQLLGDQPYMEMREGTYEDHDLEVPRAVESLEPIDSQQ